MEKVCHALSIDSIRKTTVVWCQEGVHERPPEQCPVHLLAIEKAFAFLGVSISGGLYDIHPFGSPIGRLGWTV
jgi:hypothetical protein